MSQRSHAVVLGASMAGLLAGRVLADHYAAVTIIERDWLPTRPVVRAGVPQARHLHHLLAAGRLALEELFPGIGAEVVAAGGHMVDVAADVAWLTPAGWAPRDPAGISTLLASRALIEWAVRQRLLALPNVRLVERHAADGFVLRAGSVQGLRLLPRGGSAAFTLRADLLVDASGRSSRTPRWLEEHGFAAPHETVVSAFLGYASRVYELPSGCDPGWKVLLMQSRPPASTRTGTMTLQEGGRWIVTLAGAAHDYPPTDDAGFVAFAQSLPDPTLARLLATAQPHSPIVGFRRSANRLAHYERCRLPVGLLVLGDAACALNPYYAQGMTNAARAALTLRRSLHTGQHIGWEQRFQQRLATTNTVPWLLATGEDFRYAATEGRRPLLTALLHRYVDQLMARAARSPVLLHELLAVMHLLRGPQALLAPAVLARAFRPTRTGTVFASSEPRFESQAAPLEGTTPLCQPSRR